MDDIAKIADGLDAWAKKLREWCASGQRIVDLLQPEMDKFEARDGHDIYTVRLAVDHASSIRSQTKEAEMLETAASFLRDHLRSKAND